MSKTTTKKITSEAQAAKMLLALHKYFWENRYSSTIPLEGLIVTRHYQLIQRDDGSWYIVVQNLRDGGQKIYD